MSEWRGIETAPKDGTRILLVRGCHVWLDDWWNGDGSNGGWSALVAWEQAGGDPPKQPSHWMPLPDPPKESE